ncbi:hypothetical protein VUR80DRAFT_5556 [Thermomyces stellatus]
MAAPQSVCKGAAASPAPPPATGGSAEDDPEVDYRPRELPHPKELAHYNSRPREWLANYRENADRPSCLYGLATTVLVFNDEDRVLLLKRAAHDSMPNLWECPGGGVDEQDPTFFDAAARELMEEAGLRAVRVLGIVVEGGKTPGRPDWVPFTNRNGKKLLARFSFEMEVESLGPVKRGPDHQDEVWASEDEVKKGSCGEKPIPMTNWQMMGVVLDGFRLRRERREKEEREKKDSGKTEP